MDATLAFTISVASSQDGGTDGVPDREQGSGDEGEEALLGGYEHVRVSLHEHHCRLLGLRGTGDRDRAGCKRRRQQMLLVLLLLLLLLEGQNRLQKAADVVVTVVAYMWRTVAPRTNVTAHTQTIRGHTELQGSPVQHVPCAPSKLPRAQ